VISHPFETEGVTEEKELEQCVEMSRGGILDTSQVIAAPKGDSPYGERAAKNGVW
jgi:hypothetical protein